ncbi:glucarate dehydratase [Singulisphaera sp. GP187]|uniref:enolase C-terminal domain-like protein n=1 Tax=Singulisphaera sp. GP187 TaxID=1882752 RepID=UPI00092A3FC1|nr:enolase C-terminal domain-like protein [Singulisphaera sp. GP187]SIN87083.1 glucarate dehydratase [Singulisphaera sp. GP187]
MSLHRRDWLRLAAVGLVGAKTQSSVLAAQDGQAPLRITGLKVTPIALPDPPLLFAGGCHGPYFLRNVVELETDGKIIGIGETSGNRDVTDALERARAIVVGRNAFSYRELAREILPREPGAYAAIEMACLDACGKATGRRLCELVGGPVRDQVPVAAYLFYRYAADHPTVLADPRVSDARGRGVRALDDWGEVRTPEAMAAMAGKFRERWGFRSFKLKAGVLSPEAERDTLKAMVSTLGTDCLLRIDPNARWRTETAVRIGKELAGLPMEYYEDPVRGQTAMAEVRKATGLKMSTNMCVTRFAHLAEAFRRKPIDVLLTDLHYFGGFAGNLALGPIAEAAGWTLSQHSNNHAGISMAAMIHLAASLPQLTMASDTHYVWLPENADIIEGPKLPIQGGTMAIPNGPGLGVTLDRDKLARAHEVYRKCGMAKREDASLMRRLEPGWTGGLL